jgi:hypothetical protein
MMLSKNLLLLPLLVASSAALGADNVRPYDQFERAVPVTRHQRQVLNLLEKGEFARFTVEGDVTSKTKWPASPVQEKILAQSPVKRTNKK